MAGRSIWNRGVISWSLYDFANTIYSMNIASNYVKRYLLDDLGYDDRYFDIPFSLSMILAGLLLPALGALSDRSTKKRLFVFLFTVSCCVSVLGMSLIPAGAIALLIMLFVISNFSYEAAQPFYNSLLYSVADGKQARFVSGVGVALGYVGAILGVIIVLPFVTGDWFGYDVPFLDGDGKRGAFIPTAILFFAFALPLFLWVKERPVTMPSKASIKDAYRDVWHALKDTERYPGVLRFLIADYFFEDAAATVIINIGVYCSFVLAFTETEITVFLTISPIAAVIGSVLIGKLAEVWSLRRTLQLVVIGWILSLTAFVFTENMTVVWILGSVVGVVLGGLWTTTRPMLAELVPREELGRFYGLFAMSGRAAAAVGPLVWTTIVLLFRPGTVLGDLVADALGLSAAEAEHLAYRAAILSLALMMAVGLFILRKVPVTRGDQNA
ncbi:MAG: MFS transporter [bacterium]